MTPLDQYFEQQEEPMKGFLLALKDSLLRYDPNIVMTWKWKTPFFSYGENMLAYITIDRKSRRPYLGFANGRSLTHAALVSEGRKMIKVLYFDPNEDIDLIQLHEILEESLKVFDVNPTHRS